MNYLRHTMLIAILLLRAPCATAQIELPKLISSGMVLQRNTPLKIWGKASAGELISILFKGNQYKTTASDTGSWQISLAPMPAGGPYEMVLSGTNTIHLKNILIGDVWLCAGQSNMVHQLNIHDVRYADVIANANDPEIRQFLIPNNSDLQGPDTSLMEGEWKSAVGEDVRPFSAVAYFFARKLYKEYHVPIGLINASYGGTPIEAWISEAGLKTFPAILETVEKNKDTAYVNAINRKAHTVSEGRYSELSDDMGLADSPPWYQPEYEPEGWRTIGIPGYWEDQGASDLDGVVWYRKNVELPASMVGRPARVFLGRILDADELYINGRQVGHTTYKYPQRRYDVPAGLLKRGTNTIAIRVINYDGKGGFVPDKPYCLFSGKDTVDLKGYWKYKVGAVFPPEPVVPSGITAQYQPTALYNAMVAPIVQFPVKGILWYQGESNAGRPEEYASLLSALIYDWRNKYRVSDLPFIIAQLPNYMDVDYLPSESNWAVLRESQLKALQVPHTGMTVNIDLGEWNDIHPDNKKDVGERMALAAQKIAYGEDVVSSGPLYQSYKIEGNRILVSFTHTGSGLVTDDGGDVDEFAIAGADKHFVWAHATIKGEQVVVWNDDIPSPKYVRYAWADNPENPNLYNQEGLPASPFRNYDPEALKQLPWEGKEAAVVLTYDDALDVHLDQVIPLLDSLGLKGTFYITAYSKAFRNRINEWKKAATTGHELGNHTLFHPCDSQKPGMSWVNPNYDLNTYSVKRMADEIRLTSTLLEALDGQSRRTFAYPCGDTLAGNSSYMDELKDELVAARGVHPGMHKIDDIVDFDIDSYPINGESGDDLIKLVQQAKASHSLLVFLFHGVGGGHSINVSSEAHRQLLEFLKKQENEVWTTTLMKAIDNKNCYLSALENQDK